MITAWRIVEARHKDDALSGEGARLFGGRWNSKGTAMVYTAGSLALAAVEIMVNLPRMKILNEFYRIPVHIPPRLIMDLPPDRLPADWNSRPVSPSTRAIGDRWVDDRQSVALNVPSVVVPVEPVFLLSPNHPEFGALTIGAPEPFMFDPRLAR